jgi:hypothetical protein
MKGKSSTTPKCNDFMRKITPAKGGSQNFWVGEAGPAVEIFFFVEADANAVGHTTAAACALVGRRLADGLHHELLHLAAQAVALDAGGTLHQSHSECLAP